MGPVQGHGRTEVGGQGQRKRWACPGWPCGRCVPTVSPRAASQPATGAVEDPGQVAAGDGTCKCRLDSGDCHVEDWHSRNSDGGNFVCLVACLLLIKYLLLRTR